MSQGLPRRQVLLAYLIGAFGLSFNSMTYFLVPLRADELGAPLALIGVVLGAKPLAEAVLSVPLGVVIDRLGPRRAFQLGTGGTALVALGFAVVASYWWLIALQFVLGSVRALGWVSSQSLVAGLDNGERRATNTARFSFVANVGQIVAPLLVGAVAQLLGYQRAFLVAAAFAALFPVIALGLPHVGRSAAAPKAGAGFRSAASLLTRPRIQVAMLLTFARLWIPSTWVSFFPLFLVTAGMPEAQAGTVVSSMAVMATATNLTAGRLSRFASAEILTAAALGVAAVGLGLSPLLSSSPVVYLPALLVGIGQGLSLPLLIVIVSDAVAPEQRGLALGLRSSVNQTSATIAPLAVAPLIGALGIAGGFPVSAAVALAVLAAAASRHARTREPTLDAAGSGG